LLGSYTQTTGADNDPFRADPEPDRGADGALCAVSGCRESTRAKLNATHTRARKRRALSLAGKGVARPALASLLRWTTSGSIDARSLTSKADCPKSSIPLARRRLRGVPALLAEQKNRY
jgi:hypothetical protein